MILYEKDSMQCTNKKTWLLYLLIISGICDSMANVFEKIGVVQEKDIYLFITFLVAFIVSFIGMIKIQKKVCLKDIMLGMIIGIPNYFSSRFLLLALTKIPAILVYPIYSVGTIILITLIGCIFFKEVLSKQKQWALLCIVLAICLLNI